MDELNRCHTLRGTFHVKDADEADEKARQAAADYFGDRPVHVELSVSEVRTIGGQVISYEVDYEAVPREQYWR